MGCVFFAAHVVIASLETRVVPTPTGDAFLPLQFISYTRFDHNSYNKHAKLG